jgi:hypothetical protein
MRISSRKSWTLLLAVPLLLAACGSAGSTPAPSATSTAGRSSDQLPSAPGSFTASERAGSVSCPSPDPSLDPSDPNVSCKQTDLTWTPTSGAGTWFRIYRAWTSEGDPVPTCADVETEASLILDTAPGATSAKVFEGFATGQGAQCLWVTAVDAAGESPRVPAQGQ